MKWTKRKISKPLFLTSRGTSFGSVSVLWFIRVDKPKIIRILLATGELSAEETVKKIAPSTIFSSCREIDLLMSKIEALLNGEDVIFSLDTVCMEILTPFQQEALRAVFSIPRGKVSTYGLIAHQLNKPGAVRAVGSAMAANPFPLVIPCHRVIRSDGCLGGYGAGPMLKRKLLELEGIIFSDRNSVKTQENFYPHR